MSAFRRAVTIITICTEFALQTALTHSSEIPQRMLSAARRVTVFHKHKKECQTLFPFFAQPARFLLEHLGATDGTILYFDMLYDYPDGI